MAGAETDRLSEILGFDPETGKRIITHGNHSEDKKLKVVPDHGHPAPLYKSWEDLVALTSPWREFIEDPNILATNYIKEGKRLSRKRRKLSKKLRRGREIRQEYINASFELSVENNNIYQSALNPALSFTVKASREIPRQMCLRLGEIVGAYRPDPQDLMKIANNSPWGPEGGYQTLSNLTGKTVEIKVGDKVSTRYYPRMAEG